MGFKRQLYPDKMQFDLSMVTMKRSSQQVNSYLNILKLSIITFEVKLLQSAEVTIPYNKSSNLTNVLFDLEPLESTSRMF